MKNLKPLLIPSLAALGILCAFSAVYAVYALFTAPAWKAVPQSTPLNLVNLVNLSATASAPLAPDTAVITLLAEKSGPDAAALTQQINKTMGDAVRDAKAVNGVEVMTGNFSTEKQHDSKGRPIGWMVSTVLTLKSKDFAALGQLAGTLGQSLKVVDSGFEISRELRKSVEAALLTQVLETFHAKAKTTAQTLGFSGYTLREIDIHQPGMERRQQRESSMNKEVKKIDRDEAAPVQLEAGNEAVHLAVSGSIQLK